MDRRQFLGAGCALALTPKRAAASSSLVDVEIKTDNRLGSAETIGDLIGSQYEPYTFGFRKPDAWGINAWREVGFNVGDLALFNYEGSNPYTVTGRIVGIHVHRNAHGEISLDFTDFDKNIDFIRKELGSKRIDFTVWGTPKALADPAAGEFFFFHAPVDYAEWSHVLTRCVTHIVKVLGLAASTFKPWTEPDSGFYWRGRARPGLVVRRGADPEVTRKALISSGKMLGDYIEKYVNDWHTIKAVDPSARVSGTFNCWSKPLDTMAFSLDDFLTGIGVHNRDNPMRAVTIDEIAYQDYNWHGGGLKEGVIAANALVKKHGLDPNTPLVLSGWNKDMNSEPNLQRRAAYIASNIIGELTPVGRRRTLARAYIWPFDYDYYNQGIGPVAMPMSAVRYDGDDGSDGPLDRPATLDREKRPMHAALKLLSLMKPGTLVETIVHDTELQAITAVQPDGTLRIVIVNHKPFPRAVVVKHPSKFTSVIIQRVDANHSADGKGLENGFVRTGDLGPLHLDMAPWSVVGLKLST